MLERWLLRLVPIALLAMEGCFPVSIHRAVWYYPGFYPLDKVGTGDVASLDDDSDGLTTLPRGTPGEGKLRPAMPDGGGRSELPVTDGFVYGVDLRGARSVVFVLNVANHDVCGVFGMNRAPNFG